MTCWRRPDQIQRLRAIPLEAVLPRCGAQPDRGDPRKWHTPVGVLSITGAKFMNWNLGVGGGGAIDLVMHLNHLNFKTTLDWLAGHFPGVGAPEPLPPSGPSGLQLPSPEPGNLGCLHRYLTTQRGLLPDLLEPLIQAGTLYADRHANAVFLLRGAQDFPVGAELRGTTARPWRGLAPGSRKDLGFFSIPPAPLPAIILCESAIDAISCFAFYPAHRCLSTAGARPNPRWLKPLLDQAAQIYCGFDADPTGDAMAQAMIARHPSVQRLRPSHHDWNDMLLARSRRSTPS